MNFYRIMTDEGKKRKFAYGIFTEIYPSVEVKCPVCEREWKKARLLDKNLDMRIVLSNSFYPDFLSLIAQTLISERVKQIMMDEKFTGISMEVIQPLCLSDLSVDEIEKLRIDGVNIKKIANSPPQYYRLFADLGGVVHEKSNIYLQEYCNVCDYKKYATEGYSYVNPLEPIYFKKSSWNGNDIFRVEQLGNSLFCTEKLVNASRELDLTGIKFIRFEAL